MKTLYIGPLPKFGNPPKTNPTKNKLNADNNLANCSKDYKPIFYKTNISFKASLGEDFFPSKILGISEEEFDKLVLETIKSPGKRNGLAEYVISQASKDNKAMRFISTWKQQVPSLMSYNFWGTMTGDNYAQIFRRSANLIARNSANSSFKKFEESEYQGDIIARDMETAAEGFLATKLFLAGMADPEPVTKGMLITGSVLVNLLGWYRRGETSKNIQQKQFLDSIKELMKLGILDPYSVVRKLDKDKVHLTPDSKKQYLDWKEERLANLRYSRTGTRKNTSSDFDIKEAKNVLDKTILALENMGFDEDKLCEFLVSLGYVYLNLKNTQEAEYLIKKALSKKEKLIEINNDNCASLVPGECILAEIQMHNGRYMQALKTLYIADKHLTSSGFKEGSPEKFEFNLKSFSMYQECLAQIDNIRPIISKDGYTSVIPERKAKLAELLNSIPCSLDSDYGVYLLKSILNYIKTNGVDKETLISLSNSIYEHPSPGIMNLLKSSKIDQDKFTYEILNSAMVENSTQLSILESGNITPESLRLSFLMQGKPFDDLMQHINVHYGEYSLLAAKTRALRVKELKYEGADKLYSNDEYLQQLLSIVHCNVMSLGENKQQSIEAMVAFAEAKNDADFTIYEVLPSVKKLPVGKDKNDLLARIYSSYAESLPLQQAFGDSDLYENIQERYIAYRKALEYSTNPSEKLIGNIIDFYKQVNHYKANPEERHMFYAFTYQNPLYTEAKEAGKLDEYDLYGFNEDYMKSLLEKYPGAFCVNSRKLIELRPENYYHLSPRKKAQEDEKREQCLYRVEKDLSTYDL